MKDLPDPSFFLHLSESFIKVARVETRDERPCLVSIKEVSAAELLSQPNPVVQIAGEKGEIPVPVSATLSLGDTIYRTHAFDQIGFSTLTDFIGGEGDSGLQGYELSVFQKSDGMPAPTASPKPLELVFCGFSASTIPELSDAFPNLDAEPQSMTLSALDLFRFTKLQCDSDEQVLVVEIGMTKTQLFLVNSKGLDDIRTIPVGRQDLFEAIAEVLHLHYLGSAVKLFTRSGFDSSELAPKLGELFGNAIQSLLEAEGWKPSHVQIAGLIHAQDWFRQAILDVLGLEAFQVRQELLPFGIDSSLKDLSALDAEILAKIYSSITEDQDYSWQSDYLGSLKKSKSIPRVQRSGSNHPFPTAHPDRPVPAGAMVSPTRVPDTSEPAVPVAEHVAPEPVVESPARQEIPVPQPPRETVQPKPRPVEERRIPKEMGSIPDHLLNDIEEYEGEFEDHDDYGGVGRLALKLGLLAFTCLVIGVMVMTVFFPKSAEKYLGIRPPHVNYDDLERMPIEPEMNQLPSGDVASADDLSEANIASGLQDLRTERQDISFGGLYLPTNPTGATVIVGNLSPQLSPVKLPNVEPGTYDVIISKEGYESVTLTVTIEPREVNKIDTISLKRLSN